MSMHKQPHKDTMNPGAQINLEKPLVRHIEDYMTHREREQAHQIELQTHEIATLRGRVQELEEGLTKIADWWGSYGPYPERNNPYWGPMTIVLARQLTKKKLDKLA